MKPQAVRIIPGEYGYASVIRPDAGDRPEPTRAEADAEAKADVIKQPQFLSEEGITAEDFTATYKPLGFPVGTDNAIINHGPRDWSRFTHGARLASGKRGSGRSRSGCGNELGGHREAGERLPAWINQVFVTRRPLSVRCGSG
jgi:hypothetical protein